MWVINSYIYIHYLILHLLKARDEQLRKSRVIGHVVEQTSNQGLYNHSYFYIINYIHNYPVCDQYIDGLMLAFPMKEILLAVSLVFVNPLLC